MVNNQPAMQEVQRHGFDSESEKSPGEGNAVFLPGISHEQKTRQATVHKGHKESDTTE